MDCTSKTKRKSLVPLQDLDPNNLSSKRRKGKLQVCEVTDENVNTVGGGCGAASLSLISVLAWNCRRLGTPLAIPKLTEEVKKQNPVVVFLVETKANTDKMKGSQQKLGFTQGIIALSDGQNGGLVMLWREGTDIQFKSCLHSHIDVVVHGKGKDGPWRISGFYEHPNMSKRQSSWQLIEALHAQCGMPWVVCGDFNEILHPNEKLG